MKNLGILIAVCALFGGGWWVWRRFIAPPAKPVPAARRAEEITYLCLETGKLSRGPRVETPAMNPALGRPTLVQALYCTKCQAWHRMPPKEVLERMPMGPSCPKTRNPLLETAPPGSPGEFVP